MVKLDFTNIKLKDVFSLNALYQNEHLLRLSVRTRRQNVLDQRRGFWLRFYPPPTSPFSRPHKNTKISRSFNSENKVQTYEIYKQHILIMDITVWYSCAVGSTTMVLPFFRFKKRVSIPGSRVLFTCWLCISVSHDD